MSSSKHDQSREGETPFRNDLDRNPEIGQSKGTFATGDDVGTIEGESTVEGDVEQDTNRDGGLFQSDRGRTNK